MATVYLAEDLASATPTLEDVPGAELNPPRFGHVPHFRRNEVINAPLRRLIVADQLEQRPALESELEPPRHTNP